MEDLSITVESENAYSTVRVEAHFTTAPGSQARALDALNRAYAEARRRIEAS